MKKIIINDYYNKCINDDTNKKNSQIRVPRGFVKIYDIKDKKELLVGKHNLVLYSGREWLASRMFNEINSSISQKPDEFISWFGLGDGGAPLANPLVPTSPSNTDNSLNNDIMISTSDSTCADYRTTPITGYYKCPFDSLGFEQDENNSDSYIILKVITTIASDYANGYNLSEAGLFTASSRSGPFHIFARVTFPSIAKTSANILLFIWYIYV